MYRLDISFRGSAVIGIVGAGGIGAGVKHSNGPLRITAQQPLFYWLLSWLWYLLANTYRPSSSGMCSKERPMSTLNDTPSSMNRTQWQRYDSKQSLLLLVGWLCFVALTVFAWQVMNKDTIWYFVTDSPNQLAGSLPVCGRQDGAT